MVSCGYTKYAVENGTMTVRFQRNIISLIIEQLFFVSILSYMPIEAGYGGIYNVAWTIGRLFGIPIRLHFTMVLVPFLTYNWMPISTPLGLVLWLFLVGLLFGSVLLHELGHALTARRYGIVTQDIVLTPLGGMARVMSMPKNPRQEIAIAIAGPIVSLCLSGLAFFATYPLALMPSVPRLVLEAVVILFWTNLMLAVFNLVPALPMDGGRVLRGILALKRDHLSATRLAAKVGRTLAVAGGIFGLMQWNLTLVFIAVFVYITAGSEVRMAEYRAMEEDLYRRGSRPGPFPFGGMSGGQVWTWNTRQYGASSTTYDKTHSGRNESPHDTDWSLDNARKDSDAVVVSGKAEVVGRKDP